AGEIGLEALGIRLEEDLLQLVALALVGRQVGAHAHQPDLLLGGEAAAEADQWSGGERVDGEQAGDQRQKDFHGIPLKRNRYRAFPSISTGRARARPSYRAGSRARR